MSSFSGKDNQREYSDRLINECKYFYLIRINYIIAQVVLQN